jgi:hypothetical protein
MSIEREIMRGMGFGTKPEPAPLGKPVTIARQGGKQVAVEMPSPSSPTYDQERTILIIGAMWSVRSVA